MNLTELWGGLNDNSCTWPQSQSVQMPKCFPPRNKSGHRLLNSSNTEAFFFFKLQFKLSFVNCRWNLLTLSDHTGLCEVFKKSNPVMMLTVTTRIAVVGVNCLSTWPPFSFVPGNPPHLFWEPLSSPTTLSGPSEIWELQSHKPFTKGWARDPTCLCWSKSFPFSSFMRYNRKLKL